MTDSEGNIKTENVKNDRGGRTFAGIDQSSHPNFDFADPTPAGVVFEYANDWSSVRADELPDPVGMTVANFAVNMGAGPAVRLLQAALGVKQDGLIGPLTLGAVGRCTDPRGLGFGIVSLANGRYKFLAQQNTRLRGFLAGWLARDDDLNTLDRTA